jgi:homoserine O-acetyltransferase
VNQPAGDFVLPIPEGISAVAEFGADAPLRLDCGRNLAPFSIAYQTYGTLNAARSNAILVCHALTGDQFAAGLHPVTGKPGWWSSMIGPGKPIDTRHYFVICSNVLGGCMGSTGPSTINPETGRAYGPDFPVITIADMVRAQARLLDHLDIPDLFSVIGGSMGVLRLAHCGDRAAFLAKHRLS